MKKDMNTNNILTLTDCAYIFHWSNDNFCYWADKKEKTKQSKVLKSLYKATKQERTFEYFMEYNTPCIKISDVKICVNDKMIEEIKGIYFNRNVINNISYKDFSSFVEKNNKLFTKIWKYPTNQNFYGKEYKSFEFEVFNKEDINCYRIHFNGRYIVFVCSNNKLYKKSEVYKEVTKQDIKKELNVKSDKATKMLYKVLDFITEE